MLLSIIKSFNWIDILIIILVFRICYVAISKGFFVEFFKFLASVFSVFINLHYYTKLGDTLDNLFKIKIISIEVWDFLAFFILWIGVSIFFCLLRQIFLILVRVEVVSILNKWLSFFLGLLRGLIMASLLMFLFCIPTINYLKKSVNHSYLGKRIVFISPSLYKGIFNGFVSKFMPQEKLNPTVSEILEDLK
jgi:uncharacterized membrane protein required for colicin V production